MAAIKFYVGTGYVALSSCDAYITCAGKAHTNCKFFPENGDFEITHLLVSDDCGVQIHGQMQTDRYEGGSWRKITYFYVGWWYGWWKHTHSYEAENEGYTLKIRVIKMTDRNGNEINVTPRERYALLGYVPRANRPEEEWGERESYWIHEWLRRHYGRTD